MNIVIYTDGGARGNPGPAGIGAVIADEAGNIVGRHKKYIGEATNNVAEYKALIMALEEALKISNTLPPADLPKGDKFQIPNLQINMDSELIVRQMQGRYKIKEPTLKLLAGEVLKLISRFKSASFHHIPREQNKEADKLVNEAIDEHQN